MIVHLSDDTCYWSFQFSDYDMRQKGGPNQQWLSWFVCLSSQTNHDSSMVLRLTMTVQWFSD